MKHEPQKMKHEPQKTKHEPQKMKHETLKSKNQRTNQNQFFKNPAHIDAIFLFIISCVNFIQIICKHTTLFRTTMKKKIIFFKK